MCVQRLYRIYLNKMYLYLGRYVRTHIYVDGVLYGVNARIAEYEYLCTYIFIKWYKQWAYTKKAQIK